MDIETAIVSASAILTSKEALEKILGLTADYVGGEIQGLVKKCNINLDSIFKKTETKLGEKLNQPGKVSPRVLKHILDEGRFCENMVAAEYYAGILASSRTEDAIDDRGVYFLNLVSRLSCYQIRAHYVLYTIFKYLYSGAPLNLGHSSVRSMYAAFMPFDSFYSSMAFDEDTDTELLVPHIMNGLVKEDMIGPSWLAGPASFLHGYSGASITEDGLIFEPSPFGMELYMWMSGFGRKSYKYFLQEDIVFPSIEEVCILFRGKQTSIIDREEYEKNEG